jgi:hypothetical protein
VQLNSQQGYELLRRYGVFARECCDKCGTVLGAVRFTRKGRPEATYCSRLCRDGADKHPPGTCQGCAASLTGLRRGTKFCSDVCRVRESRKSQTTQISRNTPRKTKALTGAGIGFGCPYTKTAGNGHFADGDRKRIEASARQRNPQLRIIPRGGASLYFKDLKMTT